MSKPTIIPTDLIIGFGGAAVLAVGLVAGRGALAGGLVGVLAAFGLVARWGPAPLLVLAAAAYLSLFTGGLPHREVDGRGPVAPTLLDLLTAAAAVVYVGGHYRSLRPDADEPPADELAGLFIGAGAAVLAGVAGYLLVTRVQPDYDRGPLRLLRVDEATPTGDQLFSRAVMLAGLLGGATLLAALGLWLARLNRLTPDEARQLLLDTGWQESRRELARLETWRAAARRPPAPKGPLRRGCFVAVVIGLLVFGGSFLGFLYMLSRLN